MTEALPAELTIEQSIDLKPYNSLSISAVAEYFCVVDHIDQLHRALNFAHKNKLKVTPLGGGSNLVIASDISGLVLQINLKGLMIEPVERDMLDICFSAGENWHAMVSHCLENGWYGLENLALIPGNMGAAPIQNIGAYGVELCEFLQSVEVVEVATGKVLTLSCEDCEFGYRTSIFKQAAKDSYIITAVTLRLSKMPRVNIEYPSLKASLTSDQPTPKEIYQAVCKIRRSKLPDPAEIPNVGSFFKNPIVQSEMAANLAVDYPELPIYPYSVSSSKLAAAWLIEHCGFKGCRRGDVGVHPHQALVLVNYQGNGSAILALADEIKLQVLQTFSVELEIEPRIYGTIT